MVPGEEQNCVLSPQRQPGEEQQNGGGHIPMARGTVHAYSRALIRTETRPPTALHKLRSFK